jgi:predicted HTH transcriptional regulator
LIANQKSGWGTIMKSTARLKELRALVKKGEGLHLEFKLKSNHPEKIVREIVAFANTKGGMLIIGISDEGEIKGLKYIDEDEFSITKCIEKYIWPIPTYEIEKIPLDNQDLGLLIYHVAQSTKKPHYLNPIHEAEDRKVYVRNGDKSIQASKEVKEILKGLSKTKGYTFTFGEKETILMRYLDEHGVVSVHKFSEIAKIQKKIASRTLVLLVLAGVLKISPSDNEDQFSIA